MTALELGMIARALDCYVNEYTGAAPEEEIKRAEELAEYYWIEYSKAESDRAAWREHCSK